MTQAHDTTSDTTIDGGQERTKMAGIRTELAIMRTGFTIASFGAGITQFVGRSSWPDWTTDLLTSVFILIGMYMVQVGMLRSRQSH